MPLEKETTHIGFIGIGVMGKNMAHHLIANGSPLHLYTRTKAKAQELLDAGAIWEANPATLAQKCQIIFSMVGFPDDVKEIYLSKNGILQNMASGGIVIDMTTSRPDLAQEIYHQAKTKGIAALDAPVSGGDIGAREAQLSIMVGGDQTTFEQIQPLFALMGKNIVYQGKAGAGQHTKLCNQIAIAAGMLGICEAVAYANHSGLDPATVLQSIENGAAASWSLSNLVPRIINQDFSPGFFVKHFIKDMTIAVESAEAMGLELPGLSLAKKLYEQLAAHGEENSGTQALYKLYGIK